MDTKIVDALTELQAKMVLAVQADPENDDHFDTYRLAYMEMPEELRRSLDNMGTARVKTLTQQAIKLLLPLAEA